MIRSQLEAKKAEVFRVLNLEPITATMARERWGLPHATFERWRKEWKRTKRTV